MRLRNIFVMSAILLTITLASCTRSREKCLLWKIEGKNAETSYIYGTMHVMPKKDFIISDAVKSAIDSTKQIALETDLDNPALQSELLAQIPMKGDTTLNMIMSAEDYQLLNDEAKKVLGVGVDAFKNYQPMMLTSVFIGLVLPEQIASYEGEFVTMSREQNKEIIGLEEAKEVCEIMHQIPYKKQASNLIEFLTHVEESKVLMQKLIDTYKNQDIDALYNLVIQESGGEEFGKLLIDKRNENWIDNIETEMKVKPTFFAVGAGHLGGDNGVIELLRKKGYTVTPVK